MPAPKLLLFVLLLVPGLSVAQGLLPMVNVTEDASGTTEYSLTL